MLEYVSDMLEMMTLISTGEKKKKKKKTILYNIYYIVVLFSLIW